MFLRAHTQPMHVHVQRLNSQSIHYLPVTTKTDTTGALSICQLLQ